MQCAPSGLQISGEAFRAWGFSMTPQTHESPAPSYSAGGKHKLQQQAILEYNADGTNKADGL